MYANHLQRLSQIKLSLHSKENELSCLWYNAKYAGISEKISLIGLVPMNSEIIVTMIIPVVLSFLLSMFIVYLAVLYLGK